MAARTKSGQVYIATDSGSAEDSDGQTYVFIRGVTRVREGHPILKVAGYYFEPIEDHIHYDVEQATASPGEKRGS